MKTYISVDGGATWDDANTMPGARVLNASNVLIRYVVRNTGDVALSSVTVTSTGGDLPASGRVLGQLSAGQSQEFTVVPAPGSVTGNFGSVGTATGTFVDNHNRATTVTSSDPIYSHTVSLGVLESLPSFLGLE